MIGIFFFFGDSRSALSSRFFAVRFYHREISSRICIRNFCFVDINFWFFALLRRLAIPDRREWRAKGPSVPGPGLVAVAVQEVTRVEPLRKHEIRFRAETLGEFKTKPTCNRCRLGWLYEPGRHNAEIYSDDKIRRNF